MRTYAKPVDVDPAVQSIRVAKVLTERFRTLLATTTTTTSELELQIGEAQQIYPEIWRHLDDASAALEARGIDTQAYRSLRMAELGHLGVTDVDAYTRIDTTSLLMGRWQYEQVKTATFNANGYRRSVAAREALVAAMPDVDWAAFAEEDARADAAARSLGNRRWLSVGKAFALVAALIGLVFLVYGYFTRGGGDVPAVGEGRRLETAAAEDRGRLDANARATRIAELRVLRAATCDRKTAPELAKLLREDSQLAAARAVENDVCIPEKPSCDPVREILTVRLVAQHQLVRDKTWSMHCRGIIFSRDGGFAAGLAVVITAKTKSGSIRSIRGVTSHDGDKDLVAFVESPAVHFAGVAHLDDNDTEELVFVGSTSLVLSQIKDDAFVDVDGPTLKAGCQADVQIEPDFRNGRKGTRKYLVLGVPEPAVKGCLPPGRHFYGIVDGRFVEVPE